METALTPLPERVASRRKDLKLSYEKLAERLTLLCDFEIKWQSIQQYEAGKSKHPRFIRELAKALTTTDEYLSGRTDDPKTNDLFTTTVHTLPKAREGRSDRGEGQMDLGNAYRLIGQLETRLEMQAEEMKELRAMVEAATHRPQRGTKGR